MARFLATKSDLQAWDGNVPSKEGTYLIVEVIETLRVGSGVSAGTSETKPSESKPRASTAQHPSSKQTSSKKEISVSSDDLEDIEIPIKADKEKPAKPKRGVEVSGDATLTIHILGRSMSRKFASMSKAETAKAAVESVMRDASTDDKDLLDQLVSSGKWTAA